MDEYYYGNNNNSNSMMVLSLSMADESENLPTGANSLSQDELDLLEEMEPKNDSGSQK
jgi:hypothetical protein